MQKTDLALATLATLAAGVALCTSALGQNYPSRPIRLITFEAGGSVDLIARIISPGLASALGQSVITDNRPSINAIEAAAKAPPDGYSLLVAGGTLWLGPLLQKMPYNPIKDFAPIALVTRTVNILVVHPSLPVKSVKDLIDLAKARPGELNFSTDPVGSSTYLTAQLFKSMSGARMVGIPYKGTGSALTAVITGEVQFTFGTPGSLASHVKSTRLKALAVTSAEPSALFPGLPTVAATGLPGYESVASQGLLAPSGTPAAIVQQLNQEVVRLLHRAEIKEKFLSLGLETVGSSPEQFAASMRSEIAKWDKVIKEAGIRVE